MTPGEQELLDFVERRGREFRQSMRDLRAAQIRWARWISRLTPAEYDAMIEAERSRPIQLPQWVTRNNA